MPSFLARIAAIGSGRQADLDVHAGGKVIESLERVDRLRRRLVDVDQALVGADLEVLARVGNGTGPETVAPVRVAVSTISLAAVSMAEWS
jgi:hypothetical protein